MSGRDELIKFIMENDHSPMAILGAAIFFVRVQSVECRQIADAADAAIKREIQTMAEERSRRTP